MLPLQRPHRILIALASFALLYAAPAYAQQQEKWQADLVISSANGSALYYPNDFVENPVTDDLLVADTYNNRILRYAATTTGTRRAGDFLGVIDGVSDGQTYGAFSTPYGIAVDANGNIVVVNTGDGTIQVLSSDGSQELVRRQLSALTGDTRSRPYRVSLAPGTKLAPVGEETGRVYVIDGGLSEVIVLDPYLANITRQFGGDLSAPTGLAVDVEGRIYVSDPNNNRVQVFSDPFSAPGDPTVLASLCGYGPPCTVDTPLDYPFGLAIDANGRLLVADASNNRLAVFGSFAVDAQGVQIGLQPVNARIGVPTTGVNGPPPGADYAVCDPYDSSIPCLPDYDPSALVLPNDAYQADLQSPTNIELDSKGHLLIADSGNMRVQRFIQPTMTLVTHVLDGSFTQGQTITLTVVASTTEPLGIANVTPNATPLAFTGGQCGGSSSNSLVTTSVPQTYQVGNGTPTATAPSVTLMPGSPVTFTMTFTAAGGAGPLVFSAGATGTLISDGSPSAQQRTLDQVAINDTGLPPVTAVTYTPNPPNGTLIGTPGDIGWFIGSLTAPVIHLTGSLGTSQIDWSTADQDPTHLVPTSFQTWCGASIDIPITREGHTIVWYQSRTTSGQNEGWQRVTVHWSFGPTVTLSFAAPNANNWYNSAVTIGWTASDVYAGVKQVDWSTSNGVTGSTTATLASSFGLPGDGRGLTATVKATSNAGLANQDSRTFNIDSAVPTVTSHVINVHGTPTAATAPNGWYKTDLDVIFSATDTLSGFSTSSVVLSAQQTVAVTGEGQNLPAPVTFTDLAGNAASDNTVTVNIDKTAPTVTAVATGTAGTGGWFLTGPVTVTFTAADTKPGVVTSGVQKVHYDVINAANAVVASVDLPAGPSLTVNVSGIGRNRVSFYAVDKAGNQSAPASVDVFINRPLTVTAVADSKVYDRTTASAKTPAASGFAIGDSGTFTQTFNTALVGTSRTLTPSGTLNAGNADHYTVAFVSANTGTITKKTITAVITTPNKAFDGTTAAPGTTCAPTGVVAGDTVTCAFASATFDTALAGTNKTVTATGITIAGASAGNYALGSTTATTTASIASSVVTASIAATNKMYDGTTTATVNCTLAGVPAGQSVSCSVLSANFPDAAIGTGKTVTANVTLIGSSSGNFSLASSTVTTTANITVRSVTPSIAFAGKAYDGTTAAPGVTCSLPGAVAGDAVSCAVGSASFTSAAAAVNAPVTASGITLGGTSALNYTLAATGASTTATISPLTVTPAITAGNKNYDGTTTATVTSCSLAGVLALDSGSVTCSAAAATFADANAGIGKTVTATGITLAGTAAGNYRPNASTATATANIAAAPTATTLIASVSSTSIGQPVTFTATVRPAAAGTVTFLDGATVLGTVTLTAGGTASLTTSALASGTRSITASYAPSTGNTLGSVSPAVTVFVASNQPPVCTAASASPGSLWPPNHKFVPIAIKGVTDPDGDPVTIAETRIWQDESTMADGSGDTPIDGMIVNGTAQVRAERAGQGDGRVYQIFFTATDSKGGSCSASGIVSVPHDKGGGAAVDSGVRYDSLVANGPVVGGTPPNRAPIAKADTASTLKGIATTVSVLANDTDPDGNALTVTAVSSPGHGTATIGAGGIITYTPVAGYSGTDTFTYTVSDGHGGTATASVTVTITSHFDGDGCSHDQHRGGRHDNDGSDHDKDTRGRGDDRDKDGRGDDKDHRGDDKDHREGDNHRENDRG